MFQRGVLPFCDSNSCFECPPTHFRKEIYFDLPVKIASDCLPKLFDSTYKKTIYVSSFSASSSFSDGSFTSPFPSFIPALIYLHSNEEIQKYKEQEIEIILIGSSHYIKYSDLLFSDMVFFSGLNATITISPFFCELQNISGCINKNKNEIVDLIVKTDRFSLIVFKELNILNVRILGNDVILNENTSLSCFKENQICCADDSFTKSGECNLLNKLIKASSLSQMAKVKSLFILRNFLDENYMTLPKINLTNVIIQSANIVKTETSWLSFIFSSPLSPSIILLNFKIINSFFPMGIYYCLSLSLDPYYKNFNEDSIVQKDDMETKLWLENIFLVSYNAYKIVYSPEFCISLFSFLLQSQIIILKVKELLATNITLDFSPKFLFNIIFSTAKSFENATSVQMEGINVIGCKGVSLLKCGGVLRGIVKRMRVENILNLNPLFPIVYGENRTNISLYDCQFTNIIVSGNGMINLYKSTGYLFNNSILNMSNQMIGNFYLSQIYFSNCLFYSIVLSFDSSKIMYLENTNISIIQSKILSIQSYYFIYLVCNNEAYSLQFSESLIDTIQSYSFLYVYSLSISLELTTTNYEITKMRGFNLYYPLFYFIFINGGNLDSYMENIYIHDGINFQLFCLFAFSYQKMLSINIIMRNILSIYDNFFHVSTNDYLNLPSRNNSIDFRLMRIQDCSSSRPFFFLSSSNKKSTFTFNDSILSNTEVSVFLCSSSIKYEAEIKIIDFYGFKIGFVSKRLFYLLQTGEPFTTLQSINFTNIIIIQLYRFNLISIYYDANVGEILFSNIKIMNLVYSISNLIILKLQSSIFISINNLLLSDFQMQINEIVDIYNSWPCSIVFEFNNILIFNMNTYRMIYIYGSNPNLTLKGVSIEVYNINKQFNMFFEVVFFMSGEINLIYLKNVIVHDATRTSLLKFLYLTNITSIIIENASFYNLKNSEWNLMFFDTLPSARFEKLCISNFFLSNYIGINNYIFYLKCSPLALLVNDLFLSKMEIWGLFIYFVNSFYEMETTKIDISNVIYIEVNLNLKKSCFFLIVKGESIGNVSLSHIIIKEVFGLSFLVVDNFNFGKVSNVLIQGNYQPDYYLIGFININKNSFANLVTLENISYLRSNYSYLSICYFGYIRQLIIKNLFVEDIVFFPIEHMFYAHFFLDNVYLVILDASFFIQNDFMMNSPLIFSTSTVFFEMKNSLILSSLDNPLEKYQILSLTNFTEVKITNNTIIGMASLLFPKKANDDNGIFSLVNKQVQNQQLNRTVLIKNNFFEKNKVYQRSLIVVSATELVLLENNYFLNNKAIYGCVDLSFYRILLVNNLTVNIMKSEYGGGGLFLRNSIYSAVINNTLFREIISNGDGSCFFFTNINIVKLYNFSSFNTSSSYSGGVFYLSFVLLASFSDISISSSTSNIGGVLYLSSSYLILEEAHIKSSVAQLLGGFSHSFGKRNESSVLLLRRIIFLQCLCGGDGGVISLGKMREIRLESVVFEESRVGGKGVVFGEVEREETEEGFVSISEAFFWKNFALSGANIYYYSNDPLSVKRVVAERNVGNLLNIIYDKASSFSFENYIVCDNNKDFDGLEINFGEPLFKFFQCNSYLINFWVVNNFADSTVFEILSSEVYIEQSKFNGISFHELFSKQQPTWQFFHLSNAIVHSSYNKFDFSSDMQCKIYEMRKSHFFSFSDVFTNIVTKTHSSIIYAENSEVSIKASQFLNLSALDSVIWAKNSNLSINDSNFITNSSLNLEINFECSINFNRLFHISGSFFKTRNLNSISIIGASFVFIYDSSFSSLIKQESTSLGNRAIYMYKVIDATILNTIFNNYKYTKGACITALKPDEEQPFTRIAIKGCTFSDNIGNFGSALYIFGSIMLNISQSEFKANKAVISPILLNDLENKYVSNFGKGGVIMIDCEYFQFCSFQITKCLFFYNYAEVLAPTILAKFYEGHSIESKECFFYNNSDQSNFSKLMVASPLKTYLFDHRFSLFAANSVLLSRHYFVSPTVLNEYFSQYGFTSNLQIVSGQSFNFSLLLIDYFKQLIINDYESKAELSCLEFDQDSDTWEKSFIINFVSRSQRGTLLFENVKITSLPGSSLNCEIGIYYNDYFLFQSSKTRFYKQLNAKLSLKFQINLRKCRRGEIYMMDKSCFKCNQGTYLLEKDPMASNSSKKCMDCPENAFCNGGESISPLMGYWRNSSSSTLILKCPTPEGCRGVGENLALIHLLNFDEMSEEKKIKGECHSNYFGALCYNCKKGLARMKRNSICQSCDELSVIYLKISFSIIFLFGYVMLQVKIFSDAEKKDTNVAILMKIFVNHLQTITLINLIDLGWTVEFDIFFSLQDYFSFITEDFFIIDCFVQTINENLLLQKVIFTILAPLILLLIIIFIWIITFVIIYYSNSYSINAKLYSYLKNKSKITFLILFFILYSEIVRKSFSLLNCVSIDDSNSKTVLQLSPDVECWTSTHSLWVLSVTVPGLAVWGVLTPIFVFIFLKRNKGMIYELITIAKIKNEADFSDLFLNNNKGRNLIKKVYIYMEEALASQVLENKKVDIFALGYENKKRQCLEYTEVKIRKRQEIEMEIIRNKMNIIRGFENNLIECQESNFLKTNSLITQVDDFKSYFQKQDIILSDISQHDFEQYLSFKKTIYQQVNFDLKDPKNKKKLHLVSNRIQPKIIKKSDIPKGFLLLIKNLGFLYRGYRKEAYYWELVIFTRKFILIFIGVFTECFPKQMKPTMLLIILISYICLQTHFQPFQKIYLNNLETMSLMTAFLTACVGILLFSNHMIPISVIFVFLVFLINFMFFLLWMKNVLVDGNLYLKLKAFIIKIMMNRRKLKNNFSQTKKIIN